MVKNKELILSLEQDTTELKQILQKGSLGEEDKSIINKWMSKAKRTLKVFEIDDPQLDIAIASFDITTVDHDVTYALKNIIPQIEGILESLKIENKHWFNKSKITPRLKMKN